MRTYTGYSIDFTLFGSITKELSKQIIPITNNFLEMLCESEASYGLKEGSEVTWSMRWARGRHQSAVRL